MHEDGVKGLVRVPRAVLLRLEADRTLSMHNAQSSLELLVLAAIDAFRLPSKQAVALISGKDQWFAGILVNGEPSGTSSLIDLDLDSSSSLPPSPFGRVVEWLRIVHGAMGKLMELVVWESAK